MIRGDSSDPPIMHISNLRKSYGNGEEEVTAVDGISFDVGCGEIVALLGPNGAGKTTTVKSILGLVEPTSGTVEICGQDVAGDARAAYRNVGVVLEGARNVYWRLTVRENLEYFARIGGKRASDLRERHDELLNRFTLTTKVDNAVRDLSRGMKQKVSLAVALARDAPAVFLDEPTLGLDVEASLDLRQELRRLADEDNCGIVLTSHDMDVVEAIADRVIVLADGQVITDDTVNALLDAFRTQTYGIVVNGGVSKDLREKIDADYVVQEWETLPNQTRFVVSLDNGNNLHNLLRYVVDAGKNVRAVNTVEPDLSEVFLRITNHEDNIKMKL